MALPIPRETLGTKVSGIRNHHRSVPLPNALPAGDNRCVSRTFGTFPAHPDRGLSALAKAERRAGGEQLTASDHRGLGVAAWP
ncbi:MAG: hypothetical protein GDA56_24965 [Hormoscilla sp. GM7CHS1pb]|nr:hypothetical protein [Hormoscilla sp. GM7CHS1pb]